MHNKLILLIFVLSHSCMNMANGTQKDIVSVKNTFRKMMADKKAISDYIREKGTIRGFKDDSIRFAKPL